MRAARRRLRAWIAGVLGIGVALAVWGARAAAPETDALAPPDPDPRMQPASKAAQKILDLRQSIADSLTETKYQHRTVIKRDEGIYLWDCSAMAAWMIKRAAPKARQAIAKGRPVARDFARHIRNTPSSRAKNGWQRLAHIEDVRPGDVFAWEKPPDFPSKNTGHVGFALEPAREHPDLPGVYTLRILDATSLRHDQDTRPPGGDGGFGEGTILLVTDGHGQSIAYGWFGARSRGVIHTDIHFARLSR